MAKPTVVVDPRKCQPETCDGGLCLARTQCPRGILYQEGPYEVPTIFDSHLCRGCFKCLPACPLKAIVKI